MAETLLNVLAPSDAPWDRTIMYNLCSCQPLTIHLTQQSGIPILCNYCISRLMPFYDVNIDPELPLVTNTLNTSPTMLPAPASDPLNSLTRASTTCIGLNDEADPDANLLAPLIRSSSNYYLENQFNDLIRKHGLQDNLKIIHLNIRSYNKNNSEFWNYINSLEAHFGIIALTETWTTLATEDGLNCPGYNTFTKSRTTGKGGGLALLIDNKFSFWSP